MKCLYLLMYALYFLFTHHSIHGPISIKFICVTVDFCNLSLLHKNLLGCMGLLHSNSFLSVMFLLSTTIIDKKIMNEWNVSKMKFGDSTTRNKVKLMFTIFFWCLKGRGLVLFNYVIVKKTIFMTYIWTLRL